MRLRCASAHAFALHERISRRTWLYQGHGQGADAAAHWLRLCASSVTRLQCWPDGQAEARRVARERRWGAAARYPAWLSPGTASGGAVPPLALGYSRANSLSRRWTGLARRGKCMGVSQDTGSRLFRADRGLTAPPRGASLYITQPGRIPMRRWAYTTRWWRILGGRGGLSEPGLVRAGDRPASNSLRPQAPPMLAGGLRAVCRPHAVIV